MSVLLRESPVVNHKPCLARLHCKPHPAPCTLPHSMPPQARKASYHSITAAVSMKQTHHMLLHRQPYTMDEWACTQILKQDAAKHQTVTSASQSHGSTGNTFHADEVVQHRPLMARARGQLVGTACWHTCYGTHKSAGNVQASSSTKAQPNPFKPTHTPPWGTEHNSNIVVLQQLQNIPTPLHALWC
jgi:hypothetical protein